MEAFSQGRNDNYKRAQVQDKRGKVQWRCVGKVFYTEGGGGLECTASEMAEADTLATFKTYLDRHMNRRGIEAAGLGRTT